ncbi:TIGR02757 family protein [Chryseobacterium chendengshani]|uniref:TIGR02757 family protein n=1 Tax=Chryseobacterium sp. LJ668 TaxID=2864040 RepID=UPI001C688793|nr:TIGR02757 family protein [Chryseobacterium sp. LJ668]MBW8523409.1 TIGR02757 family protein [Chryseobacterium sp. LJ668]QYK15697.1 TIGR02757 family protein [Chryseobacterium sp. LJ668]
MNFEELKDFLDEKTDVYNSSEFIQDDPVQIPHRFSLEQDIEIAGFLAATISWGNRKAIIKSADKMLDMMGNSPYDFVMNHSENDLKSIEEKSIHRTFNGEDFAYFIRQFNRIYKENESLEDLFIIKNPEANFYHAIERFRADFLQAEKHRSHKHVSSPYKNSSSKRIIMFLRWMVRNDNRGVDFGIWKNIDPKYLSIPLDVHTGNISRKLGLISRTQNDWKTVLELDEILRKFDDKDPAKYDFALFGLGVTKELF